MGMVWRGVMEMGWRRVGFDEKGWGGGVRSIIKIIDLCMMYIVKIMGIFDERSEKLAFKCLTLLVL